MGDPSGISNINRWQPVGPVPKTIEEITRELYAELGLLPPQEPESGPGYAPSEGYVYEGPTRRYIDSLGPDGSALRQYETLQYPGSEWEEWVPSGSPMRFAAPKGSAGSGGVGELRDLINLRKSLDTPSKAPDNYDDYKQQTLAQAVAEGRMTYEQADEAWLSYLAAKAAAGRAPSGGGGASGPSPTALAQIAWDKEKFGLQQLLDQDNLALGQFNAATSRGNLAQNYLGQEQDYYSDILKYVLPGETEFAPGFEPGGGFEQLLRMGGGTYNPQVGRVARMPIDRPAWDKSRQSILALLGGA